MMTPKKKYSTKCRLGTVLMAAVLLCVVPLVFFASCDNAAGGDGSGGSNGNSGGNDTWKRISSISDVVGTWECKMKVSDNTFGMSPEEIEMYKDVSATMTMKIEYPVPLSTGGTGVKMTTISDETEIVKAEASKTGQNPAELWQQKEEEAKRKGSNDEYSKTEPYTITDISEGAATEMLPPEDSAIDWQINQNKTKFRIIIYDQIDAETITSDVVAEIVFVKQQ